MACLKTSVHSSKKLHNLLESSSSSYGGSLVELPLLTLSSTEGVLGYVRYLLEGGPDCLPRPPRKLIGNLTSWWEQPPTHTTLTQRIPDKHQGHPKAKKDGNELEVGNGLL